MKIATSRSWRYACKRSDFAPRCSWWPLHARLPDVASKLFRKGGMPSVYFLCISRGNRALRVIPRLSVIEQLHDTEEGQGATKTKEKKKPLRNSGFVCLRARTTQYKGNFRTPGQRAPTLASSSSTDEAGYSSRSCCMTFCATVPIVSPHFRDVCQTARIELQSCWTALHEMGTNVPLVLRDSRRFQ
jgi:hypothetical protein